MEGLNDIYCITCESIAVVSYSRVINLVKKYLEMFTVIAEKKDDYKKFYKQSGKCLTLGIHDDSTDPRQRRGWILVMRMRRKIEELKSEFEPLTKLMKEILNDKVEKVNVSDRLVDSPCVLTTAEKRLVYQHGEHLDDFLHGVQENDGGQSRALHYDGIDQKGVGSQSDKTVKDSI